MDETQLGLFDRDEGMLLALSASGTAPWQTRFRAWVEAQPAGTLLTSEHVTAAVGLPAGYIGTNANNAVGAMIALLAREGWITSTGRRAHSARRTSHAAELAVWARTTM